MPFWDLDGVVLRKGLIGTRILPGGRFRSRLCGPRRSAGVKRLRASAGPEAGRVHMNASAAPSQGGFKVQANMEALEVLNGIDK